MAWLVDPVSSNLSGRPVFFCRTLARSVVDFQRHDIAATKFTVDGHVEQRQITDPAFLLGNALRFGTADEVLAAGEGIKTTLSLRCPAPMLPIVQRSPQSTLLRSSFRPALHGAWCRFGRRYSSVGPDQARRTDRYRGNRTVARLGEFNEELRHFGLGHLRSALSAQFNSTGRRALHLSRHDRDWLNDEFVASSSDSTRASSPGQIRTPAF
ncbi:hypothetical protein [Bradyrhizobium sp. ISRA463]|uniref:hypothetical protein n=1 Tax=unclassified Bradyrhizobium TaxID=2631580 RepID=UPI0032B06129